eukprot:g6929.t1
MKTVAVLFLVLCAMSAYANCPPKDFDSVSPFDLTEYIRKTWYIQEQMPVSYQPVNSLYCVVATYELKDASDISEGIKVFNYANNDRVNGESRGTSDSDSGIGDLQALIPDLSDPSKLRVGPEFLQNILGKFAVKLYGDYWVVAVGPNEPGKEYEWAIVSGGPPKVETDGGCRTGHRLFNRWQTNGVGLWLFSRKQIDPENTAAMRTIAEELGFDISVLRKVEQEGCLYEGARIK